MDPYAFEFKSERNNVNNVFLDTIEAAQEYVSNYWMNHWIFT